MIEQGMAYGIDAKPGRLQPKRFNIQQNLDVPVGGDSNIIIPDELNLLYTESSIWISVRML